MSGTLKQECTWCIILLPYRYLVVVVAPKTTLSPDANNHNRREGGREGERRSEQRGRTILKDDGTESWRRPLRPHATNILRRRHEPSHV